jgi:hypothetical protein
MARLILNAAHGWKPPLKDPKSLDVEVHHDAVMLSGSDLVNNRERRQELLNSFPDALGLEMEGAGRNFPHHSSLPHQFGFERCMYQSVNLLKQIQCILYIVYIIVMYIIVKICHKI